MRFGKDTFRNITTGVKKSSRRGIQAAAGSIGNIKDKVASNLRGLKKKLTKLT